MNVEKTAIEHAIRERVVELTRSAQATNDAAKLNVIHARVMESYHFARAMGLVQGFKDWILDEAFNIADGDNTAD